MENRNDKVDLSDFTSIRVLGQGSFGTVFLVKMKSGEKRENHCAMKKMNKKDLQKNKDAIKYIEAERQILEEMRESPFRFRVFHINV